jgi:hypothetical protein
LACRGCKHISHTSFFDDEDDVDDKDDELKNVADWEEDDADAFSTAGALCFLSLMNVQTLHVQ